MTENCRDMCVLVRNIVDTMRVAGNGCQVDVALDAPLPSCAHTAPCRCVEFISASAGPCVTLRCATIEPARNARGSHVCAELIVPITVLLCTGGMNVTRAGEICIPIEGTMCNTFGVLPELVAQANVCVRRGCIQGGRVCLWIDYQAEIYGICQKAVRMPVNGPCDCRASCQPFFNLPLYPQ